jgi:hypothetical protein
MDWIVIGCLLIAGAFLLWASRWYFSEHYLTKAVIACVLGVVTLGATFVRVIPALSDGEAVALRDKLAVASKESAILKAVKTSLETDAKRLKGEIATAETKLSDLTRQRAEELDGVLIDIEDARAQLTNGPARLTFDPSGVPDKADKADQVRAALRRLAAYKTKPQVLPAPEPAPVSAPVAQAPGKDLMQLRDKMSAKLSTPTYDVEVYPDRELVRGQTGRYYVVDLKNAASGVRFYFGGGRYTLSAGNAEFRSSLNTFIADILSKFEGKVRYGMFVRGSADGKPYSGAAEPGYAFSNIRYLKSLGGDKYGAESANRIVTAQVRNDDLPSLRAAFMQKVITDAYPVKPPTILEGTVTSKTDDKDRNAELILFVDW